MGIIDSRMQQGGSAAPDENRGGQGKSNRQAFASSMGQNQEAGGGVQGEEQATPEEQDAFERVEVAAIEMLYNEKTNKQFVEILKKGASTPAKSVARVAMQIFSMIDQKSDGQIPVAVVLQGAVQVLAVVVEMVEKMGIFEVGEDVLGRAVQEVVMKVAELYDMDQEEVQELMAEFQGQQQGMVAQQEQYAGVQ